MPESAPCHIIALPHRRPALTAAIRTITTGDLAVAQGSDTEAEAQASIPGENDVTILTELVSHFL